MDDLGLEGDKLHVGCVAGTIPKGRGTLPQLSLLHVLKRLWQKIQFHSLLLDLTASIKVLIKVYAVNVGL